MLPPTATAHHRHPPIMEARVRRRPRVTAPLLLQAMGRRRRAMILAMAMVHLRQDILDMVIHRQIHMACIHHLVRTHHRLAPIHLRRGRLVMACPPQPR